MKNHKITVIFIVFFLMLISGFVYYYWPLITYEEPIEEISPWQDLSAEDQDLITEPQSEVKSEEEVIEPEVAEEPNLIEKVTDFFTGDQDPRSKKIEHDVPFTSQAPFADWDDERQQDGCEEASSLMAVYWALGKSLSKNEALEQILAISAYEEENYNQFHDTSAKDTYERIIKGYFKYENANYVEDITIQDIIDDLYDGKVVIVPANGQLLGNPNFTAPGPLTHMLVIKGYNPRTNEFITNDPGTRKGEGFEYDENVLYQAIRNYETGYHVMQQSEQKVMIVVGL